MNLNEMLVVAQIKGVLVVIYEQVIDGSSEIHDKELIRFYAEGYEHLDPSLLTKLVKEWSIQIPHASSEPTQLIIILDNGVSPTPTTDTGSDEGTNEGTSESGTSEGTTEGSGE